MAKLRTVASNTGALKRTVVFVSCLWIGCVLAEQGEKDFDFTDSDVKLVQRAARAARLAHLVSDDEDWLQDEEGSTPEGSGTLEPRFTGRDKPFIRPTSGLPVFFRVTLKFTNIDYRPALGDRNTKEFNDLSTQLSQAIQLLFRNTPGRQLVTIISIKEGSVIVTLDLGSEGFEDEESLKAILEEAIRSGYIGPYGVSSEGFTFRNLYACPETVGREPSPLPRNGTNWANLLITNTFKCAGNVIGWEYYRLIPEGQAYAGVWRYVQNALNNDKIEFQLVNRTLLPPAEVGKQSVAAPLPIPVQSGDFIGILYPRSTPNNVIAQATLADDVVPESDLYETYYAQLYADMVQPGDVFDLSRVPFSTTNTAFAIRALVNYGEVLPPPPTCARTEFTCNDGTCIPTEYVCDDQVDCSDNSDEANCVPTPVTEEPEPCLEGRFRCESTRECIIRRLRCDGKPDCPDGSDERYCVSCRDTEFTCRSGQCIPLANRCNNIRDCGDGSDEESCLPPSTCAFDEYRCIDGSCISNILRCDSRADCPGGDDEFQCTSVPCLDNEFRCERGLCINALLRCDGNIDCPDRTDEIDCPCGDDQFTCGDGTCIPLSKDCDSTPDCPDNSDEDVERCLPFSGECSPNEFPCQHSCLPIQLVCDGVPHCSDESDEVDCPITVTTPVQEICPEGLFTCRNGQCIPAYQQCNGERNCVDGSDESECDITVTTPIQEICPEGLFTCRNGQCIPAYQQCNGERNCNDGSDESGCACRDDQFTCKNGQCIPLIRKCDRRNDCADASDEEGCACRTNEFRCNDSTCVESRVRCDRFVNCPDGSDEFGCACNAAEFRCRNGQCIAGQRSCDGRPDCIDGSDEDSCQPTCRSDQYLCGSGECVDRRRLCDGRPDCRDRSDELKCPTVPTLTCIPGEFICKNQQCIDAGFRCDGHIHCADKSDETFCPCKQDEFTCVADGICIPSTLVCNLIPECEDGSDELNCAALRPAVEVSPLILRESIGSTARFQCQVTGRGPFNVVWSRLDGSQLPALSTIGREPTYELVLNRLQYTHAGRYVCVATNDFGANRATVELIVEGCRENEFTCASNNQCILTVRKCDRRRDCEDGSDELNCACRSDEFTCISDRKCIPSGRVCDRRRDCDDGSDERNCPCIEGEFTCQSTGRCIQSAKVCDRVNDCEDGSDERQCPCLSTEFTCESTGRCISRDRVCDRRNDCEDRSDERACPCQRNEFTCESDGRCIPLDRVCNRQNDCSDGSDERNCSCRPTEFTCVSTGRCIARDRVCNRRNDCEDGSDESDCPCRTNEFTCESTGRCITRDKVCDQTNDCEDGSDEKKCPCRANEFTCQSSGRCILSGQVCDRRRDCEDGSDERNCPCRSDQFTCESTGQCISESRVCDQRTDCEDGSDERSCPCLQTQFTCMSSGRCISLSQVCDRRIDCDDGSDEKNCRVNIELVINPASLLIRTGQTAVFLCEAFGLDSANIRLQWSRDDLSMPASASDDSQGRLTIRSVTKEDAGSYTCSVIGAASTFQTSARLDVDYIGPPSTPIPTPPGPCRQDEATCSNNQCIPRDYLCDGEQDCSDGSDEFSCERPLPCEPNEFLCNNRRCAMKIWRCDGDNDCGDGSDESNCPTGSPGAACRTDQFMCHRGDQCVPASYQCDGETDCQDRSDEIGCVVPTIIKPPVPEIEVEINGTFTIYCEAIGVPTPLITWRLNWGNIPTGERITVISEGGRGTLIVRFARPEDAGAYTCEALNNRGSIFATPDALIIVRRQVGICQPPRFNFQATRGDECARCFCFGHTETCFSSTLQISQITLGNRLELVHRTTLLPLEDGFIQYVPTSGEFVVRDFNRAFSPGSYYWRLPRQYLGNRLTSYGGSLSYKVYYEVDRYDIPNSDPDVIIEGNGINLFHRRDSVVSPRALTTVRVPLVESEWEKSSGPIRGDTPISQLATRQDLMLALQNVSRILIRATYDSRQTLVRIGEILLTTAVTQNTGLGRAALVEDCSCPTGYTGLSCERCAPGFYRIQRGRYLGECTACNCNGHSNDCDPETGVCKNCLHNTVGLYCDQCAEGFVGNARRGTPNDCEACPCPLTIPSNQFTRTCIRAQDGEITCTNCPPGHTGRRCERCVQGYRGDPRVPGDRCAPINVTDICDERGSYTALPNIVTGRCDCKANVEGQFCDKCKPDTFYLLNDYPFGCIPCFCMGVTQMCQSTSWNRAQVAVTFQSDRNDVSLSNMMQTVTVTEGFSVDRNSRELVYRRFNSLPQQVYYWKLPNRFLGNKVTAYGGNLRFSIRYRPGADSTPVSLDEPIVELGGNGINLVYRGDRQVAPNNLESFSISIIETDWFRLDGEPCNREHLLMALADLDFLLIRATFTRTTDEAALSDVSLDVAENRVTGLDRAFAVEQCNCPPGYRGLSCEDCDEGYTRSGGGLYLGLCQPCQCNSHSNDCEPENGICRNCRHNTHGDKCEMCLPGYYGNATRGSANDCQKCPCPSTESPNQFSPSCILDTDRQVTCTACPVGHTGRRCERCLPGYQGNPLTPGDYCKQIKEECDCDPRGIVPNTQCDPVTRQCQCKTNVQGQRCGSCKDGYFFLDESNQQGCLACFCMGITKQCSSSGYNREVLRPQFNPDGSHSFSLTNRRMSRTITDGFVINAPRNEITFNNFDGIQREREALFFQLPPKFKGDKVSSYGGYLRFTLTYRTQLNAGSGYMDVDIEIMSKDQRMYLLFNPSLKPQETQDYEILLRETSFRLLDGSIPTREAFMTALADIDSILIRATYNNLMSSVSLRNLEMEIAVPQMTGNRQAPEVENCRCPEGYAGLSCQDCAPGYLRVADSNTALGRCSRCMCNGHATSCDPSTGRCLDCRDNTQGDRCEQCAPGYYGNPSAGTPNDCRPCPCPLTIPSNQFSPTCFLDEDRQVTCDRCPEGYTGRTCDRCAPNYVGNPREPGDRCNRQEVDQRPIVVVNPVTLQESLGSIARFQCQVSGRGPFNVVWSRLDGRQLPASSTTGIGPMYELLLNRLEYTDAGRYVCTATNAYGTNRAIVELKVGRPDQQLRVMIEEPRQVTANVGSTVRLICVAVSYSAEANYVLSWSKDGGNLPQRATDQNGVLLIPDIRPEDAGQYTCTGSDPNTIHRATAIIRVQDIESQPTVRIEPRYLEVMEGQSVEFRCIATGTPAPTVRWSRGVDGPLPENAIVRDGVFSIPQVKLADQAEYYCTASNPVGTASVRTIIYVTPGEVRPPPVNIIVRRATITAVVGTNVQLECYTEESGDISLVWSRQGGLPPGSSQDNGILTIPNIQPSYAGSYVCTGTDKGGTIGQAKTTVTIIPRDDNEAPTARMEPDRQTIAQGTTGTLRCIVTGRPRPTVTWSRLQGALTSNHNVQGEILRINQATMDDRGVYFCSVSNVVGQAQASGLVDIERREMPALQMFPSEQLTVETGGSVLFQCRVVGGVPSPTVTWTRAGGKPFTSTTEVMDGNGVIMFKQVTGEEQGSYICTATNAVGTVSLTISLRISGPPVITVTPGNRITAIVGETVNIECVGEGEPPPTVSWRQDGRRRSDIIPESYEPSQGTARLTFSSVSESNAGRYTCVARNTYGVTEENVDLTVFDRGVAPLVDIEGPDQVSLVEGQPVQLSCSVRGLQSPQVRWRRPGGLPLPPGHSVSGGTLYIPRISKEYDGEYQCVVASERGDFSATVILIVSVTPKIRISPSQVSARLGQSLSLTCQPEGSGPFQIEWQKVGGVLSPAARERDGVLEIRQLTAADAGQYKCIATSSVGTSEGYATITVLVPPLVSVTPKQETQQAGRSVEFRCDVSGNPTPTVRWEKEGGSLPLQHQIRNGVLVLYSITEEDEGRYICTATSETGTARDYAFLRITPEPVIGSTIGRSVQSVDEGDRVEFECIVTGTPRPTVTWSKLEGPLPSTAIIGEGILIIPESKPQDAGTYQCTATNVAGSVQSRVQLFVQSRPVISAQQDLQTAALGSPTTLSCEAQGTPQPDITWVKKDGDLPVEHSITESGALYIPRVRKEDAGTYECKASNNIGSVQVPVILIVGALVPYFPQNPLSYMSFPALSDVYLELDILLSFRPEATDGMLLYNGQSSQGSGDFVCFGLSGAFPEFRFDVGSGPAIIRGQNQLELNKWHTVHLKRERTNGTLVVNDEPAYAGVAPGRMVGLDITEPMYLGGVPSFTQVPRAAGFSSGFVGSVGQVHVKGVPLNLGSDALEVYGIDQFNACKDNPCFNGLQCQPYNNAYGYRCVCSEGFDSKECGERCRPGICGRGRCLDLPDQPGYRCICPKGYSGEGCRVGLTVVDPAFNKTSFIAYPTIAAGLLSVNIKLKFKPRSRDDGIILYNAQNDDGRGDYIAIIMKDGFVEFRFDTGSGPAVLHSRQQIPINQWVTVLADRKGRDGMLIVNNEDPVNEQVDPYYNPYSRRDRGDIARGTTTGINIGLDLKRPLFLGGVDPAEKISSGVGIQDGFVGCIAELTMGTKEIDLLGDAIESVNIQDCGERRLCDRNPCQNGGVCQDISLVEYKCTCPGQFTGNNCETEINDCVTQMPCLNGGTCSMVAGRYACSCPLGYMGRDCESAIPIRTSFEVAGDGYVEFDKSLLPHRGRQRGEKISLTLSTTELNGLVFWQGPRPEEESGDYLILLMLNGFIEFRYELGSGPAILTSPVRIDDGFPHTIVIERLNRNANLTVDNGPPVTDLSKGPLQVLNIQSNVFFGGVPNLYRYTKRQAPQNFNGCISNIYIQEEGPLDASTPQAVGGVNVRPCLN